MNTPEHRSTGLLHRPRRTSNASLTSRKDGELSASHEYWWDWRQLPQPLKQRVCSSRVSYGLNNNLALKAVAALLYADAVVVLWQYRLITWSQGHRGLDVRASSLSVTRQRAWWVLHAVMCMGTSLPTGPAVSECCPRTLHLITTFFCSHSHH